MLLCSDPDLAAHLLLFLLLGNFFGHIYIDITPAICRMIGTEACDHFWRYLTTVLLAVFTIRMVFSIRIFLEGFSSPSMGSSLKTAYISVFSSFFRVPELGSFGGLTFLSGTHV